MSTETHSYQQALEYANQKAQEARSNAEVHRGNGEVDLAHEQDMKVEQWETTAAHCQQKLDEIKEQEAQKEEAENDSSGGSQRDGLAKILPEDQKAAAIEAAQNIHAQTDKESIFEQEQTHSFAQQIQDKREQESEISR